MTGNHTMVVVYNGGNYVRYIFHQNLDTFKKDYDDQISKYGYYKGRDDAGYSVTIYPKNVIKDGISAY